MKKTRSSGTKVSSQKITRTTISPSKMPLLKPVETVLIPTLVRMTAKMRLKPRGKLVQMILTLRKKDGQLLRSVEIQRLKRNN